MKTSKKNGGEKRKDEMAWRIESGRRALWNGNVCAKAIENEINSS
jgi:hypothetical protein